MIFEYTKWRAACDRCGSCSEALSNFDTQEGCRSVVRRHSAWVEAPDGSIYCPECAEEVLAEASEVEVVE